MRISDWSSDVCSSDLPGRCAGGTCRGREVIRRVLLGLLGLLLLAVVALAFAPAQMLTNAIQARVPDLYFSSVAGSLWRGGVGQVVRSEEHTSELQSLMRISYAVFCLKKKKKHDNTILMHDQEELITHKTNTNQTYTQ